MLNLIFYHTLSFNVCTFVEWDLFTSCSKLKFKTICVVYCECQTFHLLVSWDTYAVLYKYTHTCIQSCLQLPTASKRAYLNAIRFECFSPLSSYRSRLSWRTTHGQNILSCYDHCSTRWPLDRRHQHRCRYHTSNHLLTVTRVTAQNRNVGRTYRYRIHELDDRNRCLLDPQLHNVAHWSCLQTADLVWWQELEAGEDRTGSRCKTGSLETGCRHNELRYGSHNTNLWVQKWFVHC